MRVINLFFGVALLILYVISQIPSCNVNMLGFNVPFPNPLFLIASISLYTIPTLLFHITIGVLNLALAVALLTLTFAPKGKLKVIAVVSAIILVVTIFSPKG